MTHVAAHGLEGFRGRPRAPLPDFTPRTRVPRAAVVTGAAVAAGFALATFLIGPHTPRQVAASYLEARFDQEWAAAWALTCESERESTDFAAFAEEAAVVHEYFFFPSEVDISVGDIRLARYGSHGYVEVPAKATSDEVFREAAFDGDVPLVLEDGEFRVCDPATFSESP